MWGTADRRLSSVPDAATSKLSWSYDPSDPTPSVALTAFGGLDVGGPQDNQRLLDREDVLVLRSRELPAMLSALGRVTASLVIESDAPSVDCFIRLLDFDPSGQAVNVCESIRRVTDEQLASEEGCRLEIDLGPITHTFQSGHSVGVLVASGAFPYFDRNLGFGDPSRTATRMRVAHSRMLVGGTDGISITLPIAQGLRGSARQ
ncbi:CocE/NonD family hydrolase [Microbacterium aurum]